MIICSFLSPKMYTFWNYKKRTAKQSRNVWTSFYGTSQYLCMLFETISLKMDIKKEGVFQPSINRNILFWIKILLILVLNHIRKHSKWISCTNHHNIIIPSFLISYFNHSVMMFFIINPCNFWTSTVILYTLDKSM